MKRMTAIQLFVIGILASTMMHAQTRSWVSGAGDDANPCSYTAPCKTFAAALGKTAAGGEIDAQNAGPYGAVTINKAITIDGGEGNVASVLATGGGNAIVVSAGASDTVILRNLSLNGVTGTGSGAGVGINYSSGKALLVEHCSITGFGFAGIFADLNASGNLSVKDTNMSNFPATGFFLGTGIYATTSSGQIQVTVERVRVEGAIYGIFATTHSRVDVNESRFHHMTNDGVHAEDTSANDAQVTISRSDLSYNGNGVTAGSGSSVSISDSTVAYNTTCGLNNTGGTLGSYQNNRLIGPTTCGSVIPLMEQ